jgi:hypothetical protein
MAPAKGPPDMKYKVLLADDDPAVLDGSTDVLLSEGYDMTQPPEVVNFDESTDEPFCSRSQVAVEETARKQLRAALGESGQAFRRLVEAWRQCSAAEQSLFLEEVQTVRASRDFFL